MQEIYVTTPGDFINKINTITKFADPTKKCLNSDNTRNKSINLQRHFFQVYIFFNITRQILNLKKM